MDYLIEECEERLNLSATADMGGVPSRNTLFLMNVYESLNRLSRIEKQCGVEETPPTMTQVLAPWIKFLIFVFCAVLTVGALLPVVLILSAAL